MNPLMSFFDIDGGQLLDPKLVEIAVKLLHSQKIFPDSVFPVH